MHPDPPPPPAGLGDTSSALERALVHLIDVSGRLPPDHLGDAVCEAAAHLGGTDTVVLLVDLGQRRLHPIDGPTDDPGDRQPVDGPAAGEAFRTEACVQEPCAGGTRLWVPILDSAERVGVLGTILGPGTSVDAAVERRWERFAGLVGELVVTKGRYGDALAVARRTGDVGLAAELRWALLPPLTYSSREVFVSGILEPAYEIAGDAFDYSVSSTTVHVGLFDAMGHGLESSHMANLAVGGYRNCRREEADLVQTVMLLDEAIEQQFGDCRFVTGQLATLDLASGKVMAVNAGHPAPMVFHSDGTRHELACSRTRPLGLGSAPEVPAVTQLRPGDIVLFHTDGTSEARSNTGEFFGTERLHDLVGRLLAANVRPPEVLRAVVAAVLAHEPQLRDDSTLLLLGWRVGNYGPPPATN